MSLNKKITLSTDRLTLTPLSVNDTFFIQQLLNTEGWKKFIGERNVNSPEEALAYILKIINSENIAYWVLQLKEEGQPAGLVTFIKRDYLERPDIGFALLPAFYGKGYAHEASKALLEHVKKEYSLETILATTVPGNTNSIKLLEKLGLKFHKEIEVDDEKLLVYKLDF